MLRGSCLLAETSNPLGLQAWGARGPASCRALCARDSPWGVGHGLLLLTEEPAKPGFALRLATCPEAPAGQAAGCLG